MEVILSAGISNVHITDILLRNARKNIKWNAKIPDIMDILLLLWRTEKKKMTVLLCVIVLPLVILAELLKISN